MGILSDMVNLLRASGVGDENLREIINTISSAMGTTRELLQADSAVVVEYRFQHQKLASAIQTKYNDGKSQVNSYGDLVALIGADLLRMWDALVYAIKSGEVKMTKSAADQIRDNMINLFRVCKKSDFAKGKHNVEKFLSYLLGSVLEVNS
jgi:hypothetical protein